jgi:hypothetical protein
MLCQAYRKVDTLRLAKLTELVLLPNWMALNLVDCWRNTCNGKQVLHLLTRKITHTDCTSFARAV